LSRGVDVSFLRPGPEKDHRDAHRTQQFPGLFPRAAPRERALRWFAAAATVFVATVAILGAAMAAVMLGIT